MHSNIWHISRIEKNTCIQSFGFNSDICIEKGFSPIRKGKSPASNFFSPVHCYHRQDWPSIGLNYIFCRIYGKTALAQLSGYLLLEFVMLLQIVCFMMNYFILGVPSPERARREQRRRQGGLRRRGLSSPSTRSPGLSYLNKRMSWTSVFIVGILKCVNIFGTSVLVWRVPDHCIEQSDLTEKYGDQ